MCVHICVCRLCVGETDKTSVTNSSMNLPIEKTLHVCVWSLEFWGLKTSNNVGSEQKSVLF